MSIYINKKTRVLVQGVTGHHGTLNTKLMLRYGTKIVAGVTPGKEGQEIEGVPVFNSVKRALKKHKADWSIMFVPARFAKDAAMEALRNHLNIVMITEEIPVHDTIAILKYAEKKKRTIIGPNCPGLTSVGECKMGIIPASVVLPGRVGMVSRSGTLTHEIADQLTQAKIGQSTVVGIGGDRVIGSDFEKTLQLFEKDKKTDVVVMMGEIGGVLEQKACPFISRMKKPVIAYIAGKTAPPGKTMGHAGAVAYGAGQSAVAKMKLLKDAGAIIATKPSDVVRLVRKTTKR